MGGISGLLVTVRSTRQGAEMMTSKLSVDYARELSSLRIQPDDMLEFAVSEGGMASLTSPHSKITVTCHSNGRTL